MARRITLGRVAAKGWRQRLRVGRGGPGPVVRIQGPGDAFPRSREPERSGLRSIGDTVVTRQIAFYGILLGIVAVVACDGHPQVRTRPGPAQATALPGAQ